MSYRLLARTAVVAAGSMLAAAPVAAQDFYKGKAPMIVVGFSSGGGFDVNARLLARHIGRHIRAIRTSWCRTCRARPA